MKFSLEEIGIIAEKFLGCLEIECISSENDIKNRVGKIIRLENNDYIIFDKKEHFYPHSTSYIIDYSREGFGIPIEIRVNKIANYTNVIIKAQEIIDGYSQFFSPDVFGNLPQTKILKPAGIEIAKQELKKLSYLKNK